MRVLHHPSQSFAEGLLEDAFRVSQGTGKMAYHRLDHGQSGHFPSGEHIGPDRQRPRCKQRLHPGIETLKSAAEQDKITSALGQFPTEGLVERPPPGRQHIDVAAVPHVPGRLPEDLLEGLADHVDSGDHARSAAVGGIVDLMVRDLQKRLEERKLGVELTDAAKSWLAQEGYDPVYGARPLRRLIERQVENPLSTKILRGEVAEGDRIIVDLVDGKLTFATGKAAEVAN